MGIPPYYLLQEDGSKILLEDGTGFILVENQIPDAIPAGLVNFNNFGGVPVPWYPHRS